MTNPTVYGPSYSAYVRTTRLALEEKGVPYDLVDVAMLAGAHKQSDFLHRNPFGNLPAFTHDGLALYETGSITRYVDRALPGPALQPKDAKALARVDQVISIVEFLRLSLHDPARMAAPGGADAGRHAPMRQSSWPRLPQMKLCLSEFARLLGAGPWFGGAAISLADLHLAPIFALCDAPRPKAPNCLTPHPTLAILVGPHVAAAEHGKNPPQFG